MKNALLIIVLGLFIQPTHMVAVTVPGAVVDKLDDFVDQSDGIVTKAYELVKTGGEYSLAFAAGFLGYIVLCAISVTVRKKTVSFFKRIAQRVAAIKARQTAEKNAKSSVIDC